MLPWGTHLSLRQFQIACHLCAHAGSDWINNYVEVLGNHDQGYMTQVYKAACHVALNRKLS